MIITLFATFKYSFVVNNCSEVMYVDIDLIDSYDSLDN